MAASLREALEEAIGKEEPTDEKPVVESTESKASPEPEGDIPAQVETAKDDSGGEEGKKETSTEEVPAGGNLEAKKPAEEKVAESVRPVEKAPASWKAGVRERWGSLPPDVRAEVNRREKEISIGLQQAAEGRKFAENFNRVVTPYMGVMAAEGVQDPLVAVNNLFQIATSLRLGTPSQKAAIINTLIKTYDVDIPTLDSLLAGGVAQPGVNEQVQQLVQQQLAPYQQYIQQMQQMQEAQGGQMQQEAAQTVEQFSQKAEFLDDVRDDMADLLETAARRGRSMTIQQAYDAAIRMNPELSKIVEQRTAAASAKAIESKKKAASSVKGSPAGVPASGQGTSRRDAIVAAMNANTE